MILISARIRRETEKAEVSYLDASRWKYPRCYEEKRSYEEAAPVYKVKIKSDFKGEDKWTFQISA